MRFNSLYLRALTASLLLAALASGCNTGRISMGYDDALLDGDNGPVGSDNDNNSGGAGGAGDQDPPSAPNPASTCAEERCGPAPSTLPMCLGGVWGSYACQQTDMSGACSWTPQCPSVECEVTDCGPVPDQPPRCVGGEMAPYECRASSAGVCSWFSTCMGVLCEPADCGPTPMMTTCPADSMAFHTCDGDPRWGCSWTQHCSASPDCTPMHCGPAPDMGPDCAHQGMGEPVCAANEEGVCGWQIVPCTGM